MIWNVIVNWNRCPFLIEEHNRNVCLNKANVSEVCEKELCPIQYRNVAKIDLEKNIYIVHSESHKPIGRKDLALFLNSVSRAIEKSIHTLYSNGNINFHFKLHLEVNKAD